MPDTEAFTFKQRLILALGAPAIAVVLRGLASTWRVHIEAHPGTLPQDADGPLIYGFWHESVITVTGHWRGHNIQGLASQSFDGALISKAMQHLGYPPLSRGSSSRGGGRALQQHLSALEAGRHVVVTLDGPRGPAYESKPGALIMAERSGRPVVPVVCTVRPDWRLRSWDRTQLPPPFARLSIVLGRPFQVPPGGVDAALETLRMAMREVREQSEKHWS